MMAGNWSIGQSVWYQMAPERVVPARIVGFGHRRDTGNIYLTIQPRGLRARNVSERSVLVRCRMRRPDKESPQ